MPKKPKLTPPDPDRCQAEKPNGASFMTFGGIPKLERCTNRPFVIVKERVADPRDGLKGSMSLCEGCLKTFKKQCPEKQVSLQLIRK